MWEGTRNRNTTWDGLIETTYNGIETEVCDIKKPVHFQWTAGIPYLAIRVTHYKPAPTLIKGSRSEVTLLI